MVRFHRPDNFAVPSRILGDREPPPFNDLGIVVRQMKEALLAVASAMMAPALSAASATCASAR